MLHINYFLLVAVQCISQSTILQLDVGDVVQLEASDVKIVHSSLAER